MIPVNGNSDILNGEKISGVYVFSDGGKHLYVGRSKRIRDRYGDHTLPGSGINDAPFAASWARKQLDIEPAYSGQYTRNNLRQNKKFMAKFEEGKMYIRSLSFRYVGESDPLHQMLLECYVAIALKAPYNSLRRTETPAEN